MATNQAPASNQILNQNEDEIVEESVVQSEKEKAKKEDSTESFKFVTKYQKDEKCQLFMGMIWLLLGSLSDLSIPFYVGRIIDAMENDDEARVKKLCAELFIIVLITGFAVAMRSATFNIMSERIAKKLRMDYFDNVLNKDIAFFDEQRTGDLLSRMNSDVQIIQDSLSTNISMFIRSLVFIIVTLAILFLISPSLAGTTLGSVIPIMAFGIYFGRKIRTITKKMQEEKGLMNNVAEEAFSNVRTVKAFSNEEEEVLKFNEKNLIVYQYGKLKGKWQGFFGWGVQVLLYSGMCAMMFLANILYQRDKLSIGTITTFLFYMLLLLFNFTILSSVLGSIYSIMGASDKIVKLIQHPSKINTQGGLEQTYQDKPTDGQLSLRNIKFRYPSKADVQVLNDITIEVDNHHNRVVALCGTSGCGKSSIVSMVERFYDPLEGQILFNGIDIKQLDPRWYHKQIAIVQQEPVLFSGTIKENILYGFKIEDENEERQAIEDACRQANAWNFVQDESIFPLGFETLVGERGVKLSGGQKQRIAIARALIRKPKLLILDEATSALDAESEHQVQQALDNLIKSGKQTIIVVAHRLSTIRDADEIIVMKAGEIKERGKHDELIALDGTYKQLVARQLIDGAGGAK